VNDFPDEQLFTLFVDGQEQESFDDWPAAWSRPTVTLKKVGKPAVTAGGTYLLQDGRSFALARTTSRTYRARVKRALDELTAKDREVLRRVYVDEQDKDAVCRDLDISRAYLRTLVDSTRQRLRVAVSEVKETSGGSKRASIYRPKIYRSKGRGEGKLRRGGITPEVREALKGYFAVTSGLATNHPSNTG
jgi:predicted DNA-binding protein (UPF0251 family)